EGLPGFPLAENHVAADGFDVFVHVALDVTGQSFQESKDAEEPFFEFLFLTGDDFVLHSDGCHTLFLPQEVLGAKYRTIRACQPIRPILTRKRRLTGITLSDFDATALAGSHTAGHGALDGNLAIEAI